jgi:hypothetical protein
LSTISNYVSGGRALSSSRKLFLKCLLTLVCDVEARRAEFLQAGRMADERVIFSLSLESKVVHFWSGVLQHKTLKLQDLNPISGP